MASNQNIDWEKLNIDLETAVLEIQQSCLALVAAYGKQIVKALAEHNAGEVKENNHDS